jgi:hypothetical protein
MPGGIKNYTMRHKLNFYTDLNKWQRQQYGNGCGPGVCSVDKIIPEFEWNMACRHHDFNYDIGGTSADRKIADQIFREEMYQQLDRYGTWLQRIYLRPVVEIYYWAVRVGGKDAFSYGPYLTLDELKMKAKKKYGITL